MNVGKTYYPKNRKEWRAWLSKHHKISNEIWMIFYKKDSNKPRIPYNDAVEEALCFGWIDSILKPRNAESWVQRFSPRKKNSVLSEMNKERVRRLIKAKKMTQFGLKSIEHHLDKKTLQPKKFILPDDILSSLKNNSKAWKNFQKFPASYKRIRIGWIDASRHRPEMFMIRLNYFIKMTASNKQFGMVR
jgi:uncharacterized protein YdeI (YjbR/CyaY-like superfamily)